MKTLRMLSAMALVVSGWMTSYAQEAEVPGDQFSLEGALELFKKSSSPEEFEKMLNTPDTKVNNLDLNGDGYIDYIRVHDRHDGNIHAFIIQAVISEDQLQDIAVIELEKLANGKAVLQIIGDEDIYGVTTIIEPTREVKTYAGTQTSRTVVNVWAWPSVQYVYGPYYTTYVSPWGWYDHPVWYSTWRPIAYVHYYPIWRPYHHHYVVCHTRRISHAYDIYRPYRRTSVIVHHRHHDRITHYRSTYTNGRTRDDGRQYASDNRSLNRNDLQRGRDNSGRTRSDSYRTDSYRTDSDRGRTDSRERSNITRQSNVNQVRSAEQVRRAEPDDKQSVRREQVTRSRTSNAEELNRTRTAQPVLRAETAPNPSESRNSMSERPAAIQRSTRTEHRTPVQPTRTVERAQQVVRTPQPQVERSRPAPQPQQVERSRTIERAPQPQVERSRPVERAPQVQERREVQQSRPAEVQRSPAPSHSAPHPSSESPDRSRGRR